MKRGMSMMKSSVKKIGALVAAAVTVCAIFVGCGSSAKYDTSTPDGALMTQLDALKTGDFSQLEGYNKEDLEATGVTEAQLKGLSFVLLLLLESYCLCHSLLQIRLLSLKIL